MQFAPAFIQNLTHLEALEWFISQLYTVSYVSRQNKTNILKSRPRVQYFVWFNGPSALLPRAAEQL